MSYQPRSTNPYIMEKKLNDCVGGGGFDPSVLEEIQEEISVLGSANATMDQDITDIKGSLNSINLDLIDIKGSLNSLTAPYSSTAHKTGRKTAGGKDIYEKTIDVTALLGSGSDNTIDFTCTSLIKYYGSASKTGTIIPIPYTAADVSNGLDIYIDTNNNKLHLLCRGDFTSYTAAEITIEYTID